GDLVVRISAPEIGRLAPRLSAEAERCASVRDARTAGPYLRLIVEPKRDPEELMRALEAVADEVEVISMGARLEIVKQVGSPAELERDYCISQFRGSHGIGHTRLSTESRVDLSHSQPFWAHGRPDLAIVHNGHITNYHQLRRRYQQKGVRFYTGNDSEVVGVYLAERLREDPDLERAFQAALGDLDGSFSCLAATADAFGFVKDPFALKPLLVAETGRFAAVATEEVALRAAFPGDYPAREAQAREIRVWRR
ncbi:MAG: amidophosphoribosyltransferase, partial [Acidobacteria bacterium]|nr:amidophosphoribosyltransferase [Acidobacteriota bacterium]